MSDVGKALADTYVRVSEFVQTAMQEHPCCYDPSTAAETVAVLLQPITEALQDQKEG